MDSSSIPATHWSRRLGEVCANRRAAYYLWLAIGVVISLLHLFTNTLGVRHSDMTLDDAGTWGIANRSFATQLTLPTEFHSQPPLYYVLLHVLLYFGSAPWFLRGISWTCCWVLLLFVLFGWHELDLLSRVAFCLFFLGAGITPYLATCVRPYGLACLLTVVASVALFRLAQAPSRRSAVIYGLCTTAMLYTMAFEIAVFMVHGLVVLALVVASLVRSPRNEALPRIRVWLFAMVAISLAYLPYLLLAYHYQYQANPKNTLTAILRLQTYTKTLQGQLGFSTELYVLLGVLAAMGLVGELLRRNWLVLYWPILGAGSMAFVWYFIVGRSILGAQTKYMLPAMLATCALAALGAGQIRPIARRGFWPVGVAALAVVTFTKYPAWAAYLKSGPDLGTFAALHAHLRTFPGKKVFFSDVGYDGQRPEYVTRHDPDIVYATRRGRGWASGGEAEMTNDYVIATIQQWHGQANCFFYYLFFPQGPYATAFVPTLTKLGYQPTRPLPAASGHPVIGYCR